ncbi:hypothetical protein JCM3765_007436 [Sporobolomyces pararoseus]
MNHTWAFNQLNQLTPSPGISPSNGPVQERNELTLSFPCDGNALQAQLEQWTNVAFDFDSPDFGSDAAAPSLFDDKAGFEGSVGEDKLNSTRFTSRGGESLFSAVNDNNSNNHSSISADTLRSSSTELPTSTVDLSALLAPSPSDAFTGSLVDPALALPNFSSAPAALPASFFTSPSSGFDSASLPVAPSATTSTHQEQAAAPSPAASTSSKGKKTASAHKKKRATPAEKVKALPLPEGVNTDGMTEEELNALAIEEDKRRRNTAASARFRVKKKQREQALEQTAKELQDRVAELEKDVEALRTENGFLRGLITDKTVLGGKDGASNNKKRLREEDEDDISSSVVHV